MVTFEIFGVGLYLKTTPIFRVDWVWADLHEKIEFSLDFRLKNKNAVLGYKKGTQTITVVIFEIFGVELYLKSTPIFRVYGVWGDLN